MISIMSRGVIIAAAVLLQAVESTPLRLGDVARGISDRDLANLELVASPGGAKPWLLDGPRGQIAELEFVQAYLPPDVVTADFRRGAVVGLMRGSAKALALAGIRSPSGTAPAWIVTGTESYGQVAIQGQTFRQIDGDADINRPFLVIGRFEDDELVRLARFVRSSPTGSTLNTQAPPGSVHGNLPIVSVARKTQSVEVRLRKNDFAFQHVEVRPDERGWVIITISHVFR